jgi:hypothetical protein
MFYLRNSILSFAVAARRAGRNEIAESVSLGYLRAAERLANQLPKSVEARLSVCEARMFLAKVFAQRGDLVARRDCLERAYEEALHAGRLDPGHYAIHPTLTLLRSKLAALDQASAAPITQRNAPQTLPTAQP